MLRSDRFSPERSGCRRLPKAAGGGPPETGRVQCCEQKSPAGPVEKFTDDFTVCVSSRPETQTL